MMSSDRENTLLEGKRQLLTDLKALLTAKIEARDKINQRATSIFGYASTILGLAASFGIGFTDIRGNPILAVGFACQFVLYIYHALHMIGVLSPDIYILVPGIPRVSNTYAQFYERYIAGGEEKYIDQMISNLAGTDSTAGAIEHAEDVNTKKTKYLRRMSWSFILMILVLLGTATLIVLIPLP